MLIIKLQIKNILTYCTPVGIYETYCNKCLNCMFRFYGCVCLQLPNKFCEASFFKTWLELLILWYKFILKKSTELCVS
jgi:hypothetical protein